MTEKNSNQEAAESNRKNDSEVTSQPASGPISQWLSAKLLPHNCLEPDHIGIELLSIKPNDLYLIVEALKNDGFDYLQCQGGYDEGAGRNLVCFYHLIAMNELAPQSGEFIEQKPREVRLKVFLPRDGDLTVPSLYKLYKGADWQERETFDMFGINFDGHPHPKRLLMPEDWKGWPLRKDYVQPDFYEMQDAY